MKKKLQQSFLRISLTLISFSFLIIGVYHLAYRQRVYPGVTVLGTSLGNRTLQEAEKIISQIAAVDSPSLLFKTGEQKWLISLAELNFDYRPFATAQKAFQVGRATNLLANLATKVNCWFKPQDLTLEYLINQVLLEAQTATISAQLFVPAIEPAIEIVKNSLTESDSKIIIQPGKDGKQVSHQELFSTINNRLARKNFAPIELPIIEISPTLTDEQIQKTQTRAQNLLGKKLILTGEEQQWPLEEEALIKFLSFNNGFDQEKIASWSANLTKSINQPAENAAFKFLPGSIPGQKSKVVEFKPARQGKILEKEKTTDLIIKSMTELEQGKKEITVKLPINTIPPKITTKEVNNLGIQELISQGVSYFQGSISSRIHNIALASAKLNGLLIAPGEIFSFNQNLGDVSEATGFKPAYIIKEGRTVLGDGGGVCQVSTTLFRAALNAGLPIVERRAHAYRVAYYEQRSSVGLDATVFDPTADLKFQNDTPAYILIQTSVDKKNYQLTFELYGTGDGRQVVISKSKIWDQIPPPPDLYQDDPALPTGQIKQIDWKAWGAKVAFDYNVTRGEETLQDRTFYSVYRPWQAIFLRGTGNQP